MSYVLAIVLGYLIGAVPFAYLVVRTLTGRDVRQLGSGNVGVMNTVRQAGLPAGVLVFVAEGMKGVAAYSLGRVLIGAEGPLLTGLMALIGVNWSVFIGFSGGRGTTLALFNLVLISIWAFLILAAVWLTLYALRRNNFLATRAVIILLPVVALLVERQWAYVATALAASAILLVRHRRETDDHLAMVEAHVDG